MITDMELEAAAEQADIDWANFLEKQAMVISQQSITVTCPDPTNAPDAWVFAWNSGASTMSVSRQDLILVDSGNLNREAILCQMWLAVNSAGKNVHNATFAEIQAACQAATFDFNG